MASMSILTRSRPLIRTISHGHRCITAVSFLSQEAQLAEAPSTALPTQGATPLPPNPVSGSQMYTNNWLASASSGSHLVPLSLMQQPQSSRVQALSQTLDAQGLKDYFSNWMTESRWMDVKQLFEFWIKSLDKNGKPNKPDANLYNFYLRANLMLGVPVDELMSLVQHMEDFGLVPNTASQNLILKAMYQSGEPMIFVEAAQKLIEWMLEVGKENKDSLPDDESYDLVIGLLFKANQTDAAFKFVDSVLTSGYTMSSNVFNQCIRRCLDNNRLDTLLSIIEKCKKSDQNKKVIPSWYLCNILADHAIKEDNSELTFSALDFFVKWIVRGQNVRPPVLLSVDEGLLVAALGTAGRNYSSKLLNGAWEILKRSLRQTRSPNPEAYLAKIYAHASMGQLQNAFASLHEFEKAHGNPMDVDAEELFSPFTSLNPLVLACCRNGFSTLDTVYYQLENLSRAETPYKSVAALNCIILGCANIWDIDRAYQTFAAIEASFGLTPNIHSYNALIHAFGKLGKSDEATKVYGHLTGLGLKPNATTYSLLVDAHLIKRDPKAAISVIDDMVKAEYIPTKEMLKKIRRRCTREMDYEADDKVESFAKQFQIRMGSETRRALLFDLQYSSIEYA
ncbi:PREDICTED: pentatricopeptide repeat-containing protein At1g26460, mitochondrial [Ipomoea nil]|uniref:pentatricopeptide repeat-containing protein At1g26460, mitochondrial n=1 Tax=Ipomoea nil TaxID=35883 RepID=UPI000900C546|nr:PREDICTED: pentatricopeptide repeat-containing protein At1g26460, mitochondrial [Ipomoea nil]